MPAIKLTKELWTKVAQAARAGGYSSPEEFIEHVLEREMPHELADDQPERGSHAQAQRARLHRLMLSAAHTWSLTAIAAITGVVLLWIWKRFSNQERIVRAKRRMRAQLYAMRLYADEPTIVFRAQGQLLMWSARYLAGTLRPVAVAFVPLLLLFPPLDNAYGHRPLAPGESVVITARFPAAAAADMAAATR